MGSSDWALLTGFLVGLAVAVLVAAYSVRQRGMRAAAYREALARLRNDYERSREASTRRWVSMTQSIMVSSHLHTTASDLATMDKVVTLELITEQAKQVFGPRACAYANEYDGVWHAFIECATISASEINLASTVSRERALTLALLALRGLPLYVPGLRS